MGGREKGLRVSIYNFILMEHLVLNGLNGVLQPLPSEYINYLSNAIVNKLDPFDIEVTVRRNAVKHNSIDIRNRTRSMLEFQTLYQNRGLP